MKITVSTPVVRSARVTQVESMFDVPPSKKSGRTWDVDLPIDDEPWNVGLIVGPSGSGKSTIARSLFKDSLIEEYKWPKDRAIVDAFPADIPIKDIVHTLTAVGFSSPPSWLQPFQTLSTGEQFRVTLARALASVKQDEFTVIDEFTSTVDRQVAKVGSHAVQKAIRRAGKKMIAVTCHNDVVEWLQPDWVYQPHLQKFTRRCLQRHPALELAIHKVDRSVWPLFRDHHYLTGELNSTAQCYGVFAGDELIGFGSYINFPGKRPAKKGHRYVVLPDWQGLGIVTKLAEWIAEKVWSEGYEYRATLSHQGLVKSYLHSKRWRLVSAPKAGNQLAYSPHAAKKSEKWLRAGTQNPRILRTYSFVYVPRSTDAPED